MAMTPEGDLPLGWRKYRNTPWVTSMAFLTVIAGACTCTQYDPVLDPSSTLEFRGARFTILTDVLVRMTQSLSTFEDRPTRTSWGRDIQVGARMGDFPDSNTRDHF